MKRRELTQRQKDEIQFHDGWGESTEAGAIDVGKYSSGATSVDFRLALNWLGDIKNKRILDLGCGLGESSVVFAQRGADVVALDISSKMLRCARQLADKYRVRGKIKFVESPSEHLPFKAGAFDYVFGGNVLHHVDIKETSKEIYRVLKKGGKAIFIEPLGYNPIIQIYRSMAGDVRTKMEKPFLFNDIELFAEKFENVRHSEQQLLTTLIFVWFYLGEGVDPSEVRYWKKIIDEESKYKAAFKILQWLDRIILRIPCINRLCWSTTIELIK